MTSPAAPALGAEDAAPVGDWLAPGVWLAPGPHAATTVAATRKTPTIAGRRAPRAGWAEEDKKALRWRGRCSRDAMASARFWSSGPVYTMQGRLSHGPGVITIKESDGPAHVDSRL